MTPESKPAAGGPGSDTANRAGLGADLAAAAAPGDREPGEDLAARQEMLIDEAVQETFPASDPISPHRIT